MTDLTIRRYEPGDAERVRELHERALRDAGDFVEGAPEPDLQDIEGSYLDAEGEFLLGELQKTEEGIVAMGAYRPVEGRLDEAIDSLEGPTAELKRMRVHPDHQRRGFGRRLFEELQRRARVDGFRAFVLDTGADNEAARRFYEAIGFDDAGTLTIEAFDQTIRLALYRKLL